MITLAAVALTGALAAGCSEGERDYDGYPIGLGLAGGAMFAAAARVHDEPVEVAIDILSPVSSLSIGGIDEPRRLEVDLELYGFTRDGEPIYRSRVRDLRILDLPPCAEPPCRLGDATRARTINGVIGADVLSADGRAARFDFVSSQLSFLNGVAGDREERGELCEAVMDTPFGGGGTLQVEGTTIDYPARRPILGACLAPDEGFTETGTEVLFALSTAIGKSVMSESAWDRLAARADLELRPAVELPRGTLLLPREEVEVGLGVVPHMALLGDLGSASKGRGSCRELQANRLMAVESGVRGCPLLAGLEPAQRCPCDDDDDDGICDAAAAVEMHRALEVAVLDDEHPLLQSLRDELRPAAPELDGILAAEALAGLRLDLDYPNSRMLIRCLEREACTIRPAVLDGDVPDRASCLKPPGDDETLP